MQTPQMQTPAITHTLDTSTPMDINQSWPRPKMCSCYNCSDQGHLVKNRFSNLTKVQIGWDWYRIDCQWFVPRAKSQWTSSSSSHSGFTPLFSLEPHKLYRTVLIMPDQVLWDSSHHIQYYGQNPGWKTPYDLGDVEAFWDHVGHAHDDHATMRHLHHLIGSHLAGRPGTWGYQPSFFPIYFYVVANASLIALQWSYTYLFSFPDM